MGWKAAIQTSLLPRGKKEIQQTGHESIEKDKLTSSRNEMETGVTDEAVQTDSMMAPTGVQVMVYSAEAR